MAIYVALLRGINVGGTGKLSMSELRSLCEAAGFERVRTWIQSGNVVFASRAGRDAVRERLEKALRQRMGRETAVRIRTPDEMARILAANPWPGADPARTIVFFLDRPADAKALASLEIEGREVVEGRGREVFVHYPDGQARSRLKLPFADAATGRNLRTVEKLAALARDAAADTS